MATMLLVSASSLHGQVVAAGRDFSLPRAEVSLAYSTYRAYTTVVDVTATHVGNIHNTGQPFSMLMVTGGIRLNFRFGHPRQDGVDYIYRYKPFVQGLVGFAHGFDSAFPDKAGFIQPSASSFALLLGIGLDVKYRRHLSFRAIQADYGYTRLPNLVGDDQNLLRISSGITIHLW
jgi:hypothetical protein